MSTPSGRRHRRSAGGGRRSARTWQFVALVLATSAAVVLLFGPVARSESISTSGERTTESIGLLRAEGPSVLVPLAVPPLLTLVPLITRPRRFRRAVSVICTVLLAVGVLLGAATSTGWSGMALGTTSSTRTPDICSRTCSR